MKPILKILTLLLIVISFSCSSSKKITREKTTTKKWIEYDESSLLKSNISIDTSKTSDTEITYTKITYYPPSDIQDSDSISTDNLEQNEDTTISSKANKSNPSSNRVKSIETYTVRKKTENKGEVKQEDQAEKKVSQNTKEEDNTDTKVTETSKPLRIKYAFLIILIVIVFVMMLRFRKPLKALLEAAINSIFKK